jgi:protein ImuB
LPPVVALRRFRFPVPARVRTDSGVPVRISIDRRGMNGGAVTTFAGPWRTSGAWWVEERSKSWDRDEWDVTVSDGATYRVFRERDTDAWFVEGVVD